MSKSIHQTTKGVFGGKGKKEITQMCRPGSLDPGVEALLMPRSIGSEVTGRT